MSRARAFVFFVLPAVVGHVLLPASMAARLWRGPHADMTAWLSSLYAAAAYVALIYAAGAWGWFGMIVRRAVALALVVAAAVSYSRIGSRPMAPPTAPADLAVRGAVGTAFAVMMLLALRGRRLRARSLDLAFPFAGGIYIVGQGGGSRVINHHAAHPSQRYALDVLKLNRAGVRARGLYPADLRRYCIYGDEVVSPCDGVVAAAEDGLPDLPPPQRDPEHRAGNYVALECGEAIVYLAHLMRGSVAVRPGDRVRAGRVLGRVGNSGNTTEPHLHVHAERGPFMGRFSGRPAVPIRFDGRFLVRNDRVVRLATRQAPSRAGARSRSPAEPKAPRGGDGEGSSVERTPLSGLLLLSAMTALSGACSLSGGADGARKAAVRYMLERHDDHARHGGGAHYLIVDGRTPREELLGRLSEAATEVLPATAATHDVSGMSALPAAGEGAATFWISGFDQTGEGHGRIEAGVIASGDQRESFVLSLRREGGRWFVAGESRAGATSGG